MATEFPLVGKVIAITGTVSSITPLSNEVRLLSLEASVYQHDQVLTAGQSGVTLQLVDGRTMTLGANAQTYLDVDVAGLPLEQEEAVIESEASLAAAVRAGQVVDAGVTNTDESSASQVGDVVAEQLNDEVTGAEVDEASLIAAVLEGKFDTKDLAASGEQKPAMPVESAIEVAAIEGVALQQTAITSGHESGAAFSSRTFNPRDMEFPILLETAPTQTVVVNQTELEISIIALQRSVVDNSLSQTAASEVGEGSYASYQINLSSPASEDLTVALMIEGKEMNVVIPAGETAFQFDYLIDDDPYAEVDEEFTVSIEGVVGNQTQTQAATVKAGGDSVKTEVIDSSSTTESDNKEVAGLNDMVVLAIGGDKTVVEGNTANYSLNLRAPIDQSTGQAAYDLLTYLPQADVEIRVVTGHYTTETGDLEMLNQVLVIPQGKGMSLEDYLAANPNISADTTNGTLSLTFSVDTSLDDWQDDNEVFNVMINDVISDGGYEKILLDDTYVETTITDNGGSLNTGQAVYLSLSGDSTVLEGKAATYTLLVTEAPTEDLVVKVITGHITTQKGDIEPVLEDVVILAGETSAQFTVQTVKDTELDAGELFSVGIYEVSGGGYSDDLYIEHAEEGTNPVVSQAVQLTQIMEVASPAYLTLSGDSQVLEGQQGHYTLSISETPTVDLVITVSITHLTTQEGDVVTESKEVTIPKGQHSVNFEVETFNDNVIDAGEQFLIKIEQTQGGGYDGGIEYTPDGKDTFTSTIIEPPVYLDVSGDTSILEGREATYTIKVTEAPKEDLIVIISTSHISTTDEDLTTLNQYEVIIPAGEYSANFTVQTTADDLIDSGEQFVVNIDQFSGGGYATAIEYANEDSSSFTSTIIEPPVYIDLSGDTSVLEGQEATYTINVTEAPKEDLIIVVNTQLITTQDNDFVDLKDSYEVTIPAGEYSANFTIQIAGDEVVDGGEQFLVNIDANQISGGGYATHIEFADEGSSSFTSTIIEPPVYIDISGDTLVVEGHSATYSVNVTEAPKEDVTVWVSTSLITETGISEADITVLGDNINNQEITVFLEERNNAELTEIREKIENGELTELTLIDIEYMTLLGDKINELNLSNVHITTLEEVNNGEVQLPSDDMTNEEKQTFLEELNNTELTEIREKIENGEITEITLIDLVDIDYMTLLGDKITELGLVDVHITTLEEIINLNLQKVIIPAGHYSGELTINITGDMEADNGEQYMLNIESFSGGDYSSEVLYANEESNSFTSTIIDAESAVYISLSGDTSVLEGYQGTYTVSVTEAPLQDLVVYITTGHSTTQEGDFVELDRYEVVIPAGEFATTFKVDVNEDREEDGGEQFIVNIAEFSDGGYPSDLTVVQQSNLSFTSTIIEPDCDGRILIIDLDGTAELNEGQTASYTVTVRDDKTVTEGTIVVPVNYVYISAETGDLVEGITEVTLDATHSSISFDIETLVDNYIEGDEIYQIELGSPQINTEEFDAVVVGRCMVKTTILDQNNDQLPGQVDIRLSEEGIALGLADTEGENAGDDQTNTSSQSGYLMVTNLDGTQGDLLANGLTLTLTPPTESFSSQGVPITWEVLGGSNLIGYANGQLIIKLEMTLQGEYSVSLMGPVDHPNNSVEDVLVIDFPINLLDEAGEIAQSSKLSVTIEDDMPLTDIQLTSNQIFTPHQEDAIAIQLSGLGFNNKAYSELFGGDGAGLISFRVENGWSVDATGTILTGFGLTITLSQSTQTLAIEKTGTADPIFGDVLIPLFLADKDGDQKPASVSFSVEGAPSGPEVTLPDSIRVSEEGLATGIADTAGENLGDDTTDLAEQTGVIAINDPNSGTMTINWTGGPTQTLTSNGVEITWAITQTGTLVGTANGSTILTLVLDQTAIGGYSVTLSGPVDHPNTSLNGALGSIEDIVSLAIPFEVVSSAGGRTESSLTVIIEDDMPLINATLTGASTFDVDTMASVQVALSTLISGELAYSALFGGDTQGSVALFAPTGSNWTLSNDVLTGFGLEVTLNTTSQIVTITKAGLADPIFGDLEIPLMLTDKDGDSQIVSIDLTVEGIPSGPQITLPDAIRLSEEGLTSGIADEMGENAGDDQTNAKEQSGTIGLIDPNNGDLTVTWQAAPTTVLTSNGVDITWTGAGTGTLVGSANGQIILMLTLDAAQVGSYTVRLQGPIDHPNISLNGSVGSVEDVLSLSVPFEVVSSEGGVSQSSLTIIIEDDSPLANESLTGANTFDIDTMISVEVALSSLNFGNVTYNQMFGGDLEGSVALVAPTGSDWTLTNGVLIGFGLEIQLNTTTQVITVTKAGVADPSFGDLDIPLMLTDNDGDSQIVSIDLTVEGTPSGPEITLPEAIRLSEEGLAGGIADDEGENVGDDQTNAAVQTGTITLNDPNSGNLTVTWQTPTMALTSNGVAITWAGMGTGTLVGSANGTTILTLTLDQTTVGAYTVTLSGPVDHPNSSLNGQVGGIEDILSLDIPFMVTSTSGGSSTASLSVIIEDDMPVFDDSGLSTELVLDNQNRQTVDLTSFTGLFAAAGSDGLKALGFREVDEWTLSNDGLTLTGYGLRITLNLLVTPQVLEIEQTGILPDNTSVLEIPFGLTDKDDDSFAFAMNLTLPSNDIEGQAETYEDHNLILSLEHFGLSFADLTAYAQDSNGSKTAFVQIDSLPGDGTLYFNIAKDGNGNVLTATVNASGQLEYDGEVVSLDQTAVNLGMSVNAWNILYGNLIFVPAEHESAVDQYNQTGTGDQTNTYATFNYSTGTVPSILIDDGTSLQDLDLQQEATWVKENAAMEIDVIPVADDVLLQVYQKVGEIDYQTVQNSPFFTVTAFNADGSDASIMLNDPGQKPGYISWTFPDGFGVVETSIGQTLAGIDLTQVRDVNDPNAGLYVGAINDADFRSEIAYDASEGASEMVKVDLKYYLEQIKVTLAWLNPGETAVVEFYKDGQQVGEDIVFDGGGDDVDEPVLLMPTIGGTFNEVRFTAGDDPGDDYLIHKIEFSVPMDSQAQKGLPIDFEVMSGLSQDIDGSETINAIWVHNIPVGITLTDGVHNFTATEGNTSVNLIAAGFTAESLDDSFKTETDIVEVDGEEVEGSITTVKEMTKYDLQLLPGDYTGEIDINVVVHSQEALVNDLIVDNNYPLEKETSSSFLVQVQDWAGIEAGTVDPVELSLSDFKPSSSGTTLTYFGEESVLDISDFIDDDQVVDDATIGNYLQLGDIDLDGDSIADDKQLLIDSNGAQAGGSETYIFFANNDLESLTVKVDENEIDYNGN